MKLSRCFLASLSGLWIASTATVAAAGCCTNNYKTCNYDGEWWTEENCLEDPDTVWLPNGPLSDCVQRWASTCEDDSYCCAGLFCEKTPGWNSCQVPPEGYTFAATATTTTTTADATTAPGLSVGDCPFIELNFTDVENGAHGYYGQTPMLQKGDYLFDQLWYSHGVKVSARVRKVQHHASNKAIFIPLYNRTTNTWENMKQLTDPEDVTSGGAVRLLDTLHPVNAGNGDGDPDLGAPNENCENIESNKPGICGTKRCGGGTYTQEQVNGVWKDTDSLNPYANCKELGLVCIIEENGTTDPDDTAWGGFITFTFREPIDLELTSLLDIDDDTVPYIVLTYSDGQKSEKVYTEVTHENGFFPLTGDLWGGVKTSDVVMVDVRYQSSGSLNSMVYQYCPKTPTAVIKIIKYAGPPGKCSEGMTHDLFDDTYLATVGNNFVYCYEISYPIVANADQEFLYDVKMADQAPGGMLSYDLTDPDELFRPGDKIYIEGQTHQVQPGGEAYYDAYVEGIGKFTGVKVTDTDPARVVAHSILTTSEEPWCDTKFNMYECWEVANLGPDTSSSDFVGEFGRLKGRQVNSPEGYESRIAFLVGGSYVAVKAAEIEGKAVVLGNFIIEASGTNSIGHAGVGSGIFPKSPSAHLQVGGDLDGGKTDGETWFMEGASVEYGGSCISDPRNAKNVTVPQPDTWVYPDTLACGTMFVPTTAVDGVEPSISQVLMDKTPYEKLFLDLQHKSKYWYSLKPNGEIVLVGTNTHTMTLKVAEGDTNCLQVFLMEHHHLQGLTAIKIDPSLNGKTILINVSPFDADGNVNEVVINGIHSVFDTDNVRDYTSTDGFSPTIKRAMLWNFYGAPDVTLGPDGGLQMPGSILIPHGNLNFHWPGQDGRTIVYGNVVHDGVGSEFHNYEFDPPCDLPLPPDTDMPDQCIIPITDCGTPSPAPSTYPTMAPTDCVHSNDESSTCKGFSMVSTINIRGDVLPEMPSGSDLIYNFTHQGPVDARTIKFNVDNPFDFPVDIYVQYNKQVGVTSAGDAVCAERFDTPGCDEDAAVIEAVCLYPSTMSGTPFVWIQVYFVSNHTSFGNADNTVSDLYDCCDQKEGTMNDPIVQYTLKIDCGCPTVVTDAH